MKSPSHHRRRVLKKLETETESLERTEFQEEGRRKNTTRRIKLMSDVRKMGTALLAFTVTFYGRFYLESGLATDPNTHRPWGWVVAWILLGISVAATLTHDHFAAFDYDFRLKGSNKLVGRVPVKSYCVAMSMFGLGVFWTAFCAGYDIVQLWSIHHPLNPKN